MNVHPSVGVNPSGPTTDELFAPDVIYKLKIDTNGDADLRLEQLRISHPRGNKTIGRWYCPHLRTSYAG
jgi:hypothetical protein